MANFYPGRIGRMAYGFAWKVVKDGTNGFTPNQLDDIKNLLPDEITNSICDFFRTIINHKKSTDESIQLKPLVKEGKKLIVEGDYAVARAHDLKTQEDLDKAFNGLYKVLQRMYGKNLNTTQYNKIIKSLDNVQRYINEAKV